MKKYRVKITRDNKVSVDAWLSGKGVDGQVIISDEIMTIAQIEELGKNYIGDIHKDKNDLKKNIEYIKVSGEEFWSSLYTDIEIYIKEIKQ